MMLRIPRNRLPTIAARNPSTLKPGTNAAVSLSMKAFTTHTNKPQRQKRYGERQQNQEGPNERVGEPENERADHGGGPVLDFDAGHHVPDDGKQARRDQKMDNKLDHFLWPCE